MTTTICVIAPGAMGAAVGAVLSAGGAAVLTSLSGRSADSARRAGASGMSHAEDGALAAADAILSIVPPDQALPLARRLAPAIAGAGRGPLYVDLNAINPATAHEIGDALAGSGARYVDGSIIGGPPKPGSAATTFYLSGSAAADAGRLLGAHGLRAKPLEGDVGAASALKMCYGGLTKGFTGLAAAIVLAAAREGAAGALLAELAQSQPELLARIRRALPDMLPKAYRWAPEMAEIAGFLGPFPPGAAIYSAMASLYEALAADQAALAPPLLDFVNRPAPDPA